MNMTGKSTVIIALLVIIAGVAESAPRRNRRSSTPLWHRPCGEDIEASSTPVENFEEEVAQGLRSISLQHQVMMNNYLSSDYEFLYEGARLGTQKHQYIPTWVPGKKDVTSVRKLKKARSETIANHLPKLHTDLQKFAVAFEELIEDENGDKLNQVLRSTQDCLLMTLCEVESVLASLPPLQIPRRINRSIMSPAERNPADDTRRLVRDWGVLLKYKDYLHAWRHVFGY